MVGCTRLRGPEIMDSKRKIPIRKIGLGVFRDEKILTGPK